MLEVPTAWMTLLDKGPYAFVVAVLMAVIAYLVVELRSERSQHRLTIANSNADKDKFLTVIGELRAALQQSNLLIRLVLKLGDDK
jgi:hypothetical protein